MQILHQSNPPVLTPAPSGRQAGARTTSLRRKSTGFLPREDFDADPKGVRKILYIMRLKLSGISSERRSLTEEGTAEILLRFIYAIPGLYTQTH